MKTAIIDLMRTGVRPVTTVGLNAAFVVAVLSAVFGVDRETATFAAAALGSPAGMTLMYYFKVRDEVTAREV